MIPGFSRRKERDDFSKQARVEALSVLQFGNIGFLKTATSRIPASCWLRWLEHPGSYSLKILKLPSSGGTGSLFLSSKDMKIRCRVPAFVVSFIVEVHLGTL